MKKIFFTATLATCCVMAFAQNVVTESNGRVTVRNANDSIITQIDSVGSGATGAAFNSDNQRHRLVAAFSAEPRPFHRGHEFLGTLFNDWKFSTVVNYGTGRPVNATVSGDPNQDSNGLNDRLPGYSRNAFTGPDYATTDLRVTRIIRFGERYKLNFVAESFNLFNRDNQRVTITSNGLVATSSTFVQSSTQVGIAPYPGYYQQPLNFAKPNAAYAPRQVQLALKLVF